MKKLFFICLFFITISGYTQEIPKISFSVHAGANYSNFRGYDIPAGFNSVYSESPAFAFLIGIGVEYKFSNKISLKVELNYERKSQKADNLIGLGSYDEPMEFYEFTSKKIHNYLVLPVLFKYKFKEVNSFYVNGGVFVGYLQNSELTNDLEIPDMPNPDVNTTDIHKKIDFGFSAGLGKEFTLNKGIINIEVRNNLGLTNTAKFNVWGNGSLKTNSLCLIVGYSFN